MGVIEPALGKGPRKKSLAEIREISGDFYDNNNFI